MPHAHTHSHDHAPHRPGRAFRYAIGLNLIFVAIEATFGFLANSVALLADAGHNLSDVLGLALAWGASVLASRPPSGRYTYGLRSATIWAALANAVALLVAVGAIALEALHRLAQPAPVAGTTVIAVALAGVAVNAVSAALFLGGRQDLNVRAAFLHLVSDAAVSLGVAVSGVAIVLTGMAWIDPATSLLVAALIIAATWQLLRESLALSLQSVPRAIDPAAVRSFIEAIPGVASVHDLHVWAISTADTALTAHLVMPHGHPGDAFLARIAHELAEHFAIGHATLQIEFGDGAIECRLAPDDTL